MAACDYHRACADGIGSGPYLSVIVGRIALMQIPFCLGIRFAQILVIAVASRMARMDPEAGLHPMNGR